MIAAGHGCSEISVAVADGQDCRVCTVDGDGWRGRGGRILRHGYWKGRGGTEAWLSHGGGLVAAYLPSADQMIVSSALENVDLVGEPCNA